MKRHAALLSMLSLCLEAGATEHYHLDTRVRQLEVDQRTQQVQSQLRSSSAAMQSSMPNQRATYNPASLPAYTTVPRTVRSPTPDMVQKFLEKLGDQDKGSGIYAYPPEERLYHYGLICIETGFVAEGVRAITEHTRIQAETAVFNSRTKPE